MWYLLQIPWYYLNMAATFEYLGMFMLANILIINGNAHRK